MDAESSRSRSHNGRSEDPSAKKAESRVFLQYDDQSTAGDVRAGGSGEHQDDPDTSNSESGSNADSNGSDGMLANAYSRKLMSRIGKIIPEEELSFLTEQCGDDLDAAVKLYRGVFSDEDVAPSHTFEPVKLTKDTKKGKEKKNKPNGDTTALRPLTYRDQFWDKNKRAWRLVKPTKAAKPSKKYDRYILLVRRVYSEKMVYERTEVDIKGSILRKVMRNIFDGADGFVLSDNDISLAPEYFYWARHYLIALRDHPKIAEDQSTSYEVQAALQFTEEQWPALIPSLETMLSQNCVTFEYLWAIFPPNVLVVGRDPLRELRVYRALEHTSKRLTDGSIVLFLRVEYADSNGQSVGLADYMLQIPHFNGTKSIEDLPYAPLYLHPKRLKIWDYILSRTEKQLSFHEHEFKIQEHTGHGLIMVTDKEDQKKIKKFNFHGRVMIDPQKMNQVEPENMIPDLRPFPKTSTKTISKNTPDGKPSLEITDLLKLPDDSANKPSKTDPFPNASDLDEDDFEDLPFILAEESPQSRRRNPCQDLTEDQRLLFSGLLYGYCLVDAQWGAFAVSSVSDVTWNGEIFKSLVMDPTLKDLMYRLVKGQATDSGDFDDFVRGKGKGLIGLLYGAPGLGKTYTAEAIAETAQMPLYMISSGALGPDSDRISQSLSRVLDLATHWRAVLLLDEADVFLAKRNDNDLERNAIVSVFLRELEYYPGILILTTNQAEIIDPAFQSRIHFCHQYPPLDFPARRKIWENFINKMRQSNLLTVYVDDSGLDQLARLDYNGRQIKNATSIAVKLAAESEGKVLATTDILSAANTLQNFGFVKEKIKPRSVSPRPPPPPHKPSTSIHLTPSGLRR